MRLHVDGVGPVTLSPADFVAAGGEGSVYARDGVAYKVLADPAQLDLGRLAALARVRAPRVVLPDRLLRDDAGAVVGFSMPFLADAVPLPRLCTRAYRDQVGLDAGRAIALVEGLRETVAAIHASGARVVDLNPMNVLADATLTELWFIDAASWQLPGYPATALLDAVRDRHAPPGVFDEGTDWFSFAVVTFQLLVGIHPYKGAHPALKSLDARMNADCSVFRPEVVLPPTCLPTDVIPGPWRAWYEAVFERRERRPPPIGAPAPSWTLRPAAATDLILVEVAALGEPLRAWIEGPATAAIGADAVWIDGARLALPGVEAAVFTPKGRPIFAWREAGRLRLADAVGPIPCDLRADALMATRGRLIVRAGDRLVELILHDGARPIAAPRVIGNVLRHATRLFPGVAIQDLHGACWAHLPARPGACFAVHLQELDNKRVVDAIADGPVLIVLTADGAAVDRWTFRFDAAFTRRDAHVEPDVAAGLDLVVLDTGVAVRRGERGLDLLRAAPGSGELRSVDAPDGRLVRLGAHLGLIRGDRVLRLQLR